jgi:hypothetical protein
MTTKGRSAATSSVETASAQPVSSAEPDSRPAGGALPTSLDPEAARLERADAAAGRVTAADNPENQPEVVAVQEAGSVAATEDMVLEGDALSQDADAASGEPVEVVRYNGWHFERREFTSADLAQLGYPDHAPIVWGQENNWTVRRSELDFMDADVFDRVVVRDGKFVVETIGG